MVIDIEPGQVTIRAAEAILGTDEELRMTPQGIRVIAEHLESEGLHTVAAEGLYRAADQAEQQT